MALKACFEDFYKKILEAFPGDDVSEDYDVSGYVFKL